LLELLKKVTAASSYKSDGSVYDDMVLALNFAFGEGRKIVCDVFYCEYSAYAC
jgi:hypothetical protein